MKFVAVCGVGKAVRSIYWLWVGELGESVTLI